MAKPDLHIPAEEMWERTHEWRGQLQALAKYPNVAVKLSGVFSELDYDQVTADVECIAQQILPWVLSIFTIFGAPRVIWGSDWPVCNIGYGNMVGREKQDGAWEAWRAVSERLLELLVEKGDLTKEEVGGVWGQVVARIYKLGL
jgi:L-rhamnono-1,4-lactonase